MGLRKPIVDNRTAEQILQDMTQKERRQFEKDCEYQITQQEHLELLESIKADPSANFDVYGDRNEFLRQLMAGEFDE